MKNLAITLLITIFLAGCTASGDYKQYLQAQGDANRVATESQKPLVRLTAQPGQAITGLSSLEVFMPTVMPVVQQARPSEWAGVLGQGISVLGSVAGIHAAGQAAVGLADSVGRAGTTGYQYVQAPQANIATDSSNRSVTTTTTTSTGDNSGSNSGNSGRISGAGMSETGAIPLLPTDSPVVTP